MIVKKVADKMPENCLDCPEVHCRLPMRRTGKGQITDSVKNKYIKVRHELCPLIELDEELQKNYDLVKACLKL